MLDQRSLKTSLALDSCVGPGVEEMLVLEITFGVCKIVVDGSAGRSGVSGIVFKGPENCVSPTKKVSSG